MNLNIFILNIFIFLLGAQILRSFLGPPLLLNMTSSEINSVKEFISKFSKSGGWIYKLYSFKNIKLIFLLSIFIIFSLLFYQSYLQYPAWFSNEFSKHLLGQRVEFDNLNISVNYFIFYAITRFFAPYFISLVAALVFLISAKKLNKKYEERFFEPEELWLGALAFFLLGHPGWLFYFVGLIIIYFIIHLLSLVISHKSLVISLYYMWLPTAIFVIISNKWLIELELWKLLKI